MSETNPTMEDLFGEVISSYSRAQAIDDGMLVELPQDLLTQGGFKIPVAMTNTVYSKLVAMTPAAKRAGNDVTGRAWDVIWMLSKAVKNASGSEIRFQVLAVTDRIRPTLYTLKAICGPGDNMEPVITIMFPEED